MQTITSAPVLNPPTPPTFSGKLKQVGGAIIEAIGKIVNGIFAKINHLFQYLSDWNQRKVTPVKTTPEENIDDKADPQITKSDLSGEENGKKSDMPPITPIVQSDAPDITEQQQSPVELQITQNPIQQQQEATDLEVAKEEFPPPRVLLGTLTEVQEIQQPQDIIHQDNIKTLIQVSQTTASQKSTQDCDKLLETINLQDNIQSSYRQEIDSIVPQELLKTIIQTANVVKPYLKPLTPVAGFAGALYMAGVSPYTSIVSTSLVTGISVATDFCVHVNNQYNDFNADVDDKMVQQQKTKEKIAQVEEQIERFLKLKARTEELKLQLFNDLPDNPTLTELKEFRKNQNLLSEQMVQIDAEIEDRNMYIESLTVPLADAKPFSISDFAQTAYSSYDVQSASQKTFERVRYLSGGAYGKMSSLFQKGIPSLSNLLSDKKAKIDNEQEQPALSTSLSKLSVTNDRKEEQTISGQSKENQSIEIEPKTSREEVQFNINQIQDRLKNFKLTTPNTSPMKTTSPTKTVTQPQQVPKELILDLKSSTSPTLSPEKVSSTKLPITTATTTTTTVSSKQKIDAHQPQEPDIIGLLSDPYDDSNSKNKDGCVQQ